MTLPLTFRPEAQADLTAARDWYESHQAGLGQEFADVAEEFFTRVRATPALYASVLGNVRRGRLRRFPYVVYYRHLEDRVEVIAVLHGRQRPETWRSRADS